MNIAFIPVRCGSKSIPFKNIKDFCGKPLIYWNALALQNSKSIDKIFIATDCDKIKNIVNNFGFSKVNVYERDKKNAEDISSTESVMIEFIKKNNFNNDDLFILAQATSPLTQSSDFDQALKQLKTKKADSLLTCTISKSFFWKNDGTALNYDYKNRPRRQDFDGVLVENGAFYINSVKNILKDKNRLSGNKEIFIMDEYKSVDIDEEDDWIIAEKIMKKYSKELK